MPSLPADALICTSPLSEIDEAIARLGCSHLVSLLEPESMIKTPRGIAPERHLKLGLSDSPPPGAEHQAARGEQVAALLDFAAQWDGRDPMLIHCMAGISRSTAAAFIILCACNGGKDELQLASHLRRHIAHASPNMRLIKLADELLTKQGRMVRAVAELGAPQFSLEGRIACMPVHL